MTIMKQECINHISKRMCRGLAAALKAPAVGGSLGGACKLTQVRMKKMSTYYRNAIVKHAPDVAATRMAIWAIYYHSVSTIDEPRHEHCDVDWCWWMQAMAAGVDPEQYWQETRHDRPLPRPAAERLMPVFERLSHPELLERCSLLGTSNGVTAFRCVAASTEDGLHNSEHSRDCRRTCSRPIQRWRAGASGRGELGCARLVD